MQNIDHLILPEERLASSVAAGTPVQSISQSSEPPPVGGVFFAVRGAKVDGHFFAELVLTAGAAAVVVESRELFEKLPRAILVSSTRLALGRAAARWYGEPSRGLELVGITGTNGKTTSTYLLRSIWEAVGICSGLIGTVENWIGPQSEKSTLTTPDPLTLQSLFARMRASGVTHAAMEVSSIALDQWRVAGSRFRVALFTNLTQDHLDYHGNFEAYYEAKRRLFMDYRPDFAILNRDDAYGRRLEVELARWKVLSYSLQDPSADFFTESIDLGRDRTRARIRTPTGAWDLDSPLIGRHNLANCLGVMTTCFALGHDLSAVVVALHDAYGAPGRLERVMPTGAYPSVFVDYAHTDDALANVLNSLAVLKRDSDARIITVFGCGGDRDPDKRPKMASVASRMSDITIATSDNPRTENPETILDQIERGIDRTATIYHRLADRREAIRLALSEARPRDLVLIAGKGHETYQIIGTRQFPFDDRQVVRDYYHSR